MTFRRLRKMSCSSSRRKMRRKKTRWRLMMKMRHLQPVKLLRRRCKSASTRRAVGLLLSQLVHCCFPSFYALTVLFARTQ